MAILQFARSLPDVDKRDIGLWGISQAGWFVPKVAARSPDLAFLILVSPGGVSPARQLTFYMRGQFRAMGLNSTEIDAAARAYELTTFYYATGRGYEKAQAAMSAIAKEPWFAKVVKHPFWHDMAAPGRIYPPDQLRAEVARRPKDFVFYRAPTTIGDYSADYRKIRAPTLVIYGGRDPLVPTAESRAILERTLGAKDVTFRMFEAGDHDIKTSPTEVAAGYLELMRDFILAHLRH
jgi:pimeloyl-ACP methyl ester carboxylesterase